MTAKGGKKMRGPTATNQFEQRFFNDFEYLTRDREESLISDLKSPDSRVVDKAVELLTTSHMRLVLKMVNQKSRKIKGSSFDREDLIQEAVIGLCSAARNFDASHGVRFGTYAAYWIKQAIDNYIHVNNYSLRFPITQVNKRVVSFYHQTRNKIENEHPEGLNEDEMYRLVGEVLQVQPDTLKGLTRVMDIAPYDLDAQNLFSDEGSKFERFLIDESPLQDEVLNYQLEMERKFRFVEEVVKELSPRENFIYRKRILCHDEDRSTLEALGKKYGVSKERIRQIETRIIEKLHFGVPKAIRKAKRKCH